MTGIDALTWAKLCAHDDLTARLRVIDTTLPAPAPGLPCIANVPCAMPDLRRAKAAAITDPEPRDRQTLQLPAQVEIDDAGYLTVASLPLRCDCRASLRLVTV